MTERIDHVAEAKRIQGGAREIIRATKGDLAPHMAAVIMLDDARLEAALALVEQQRIANLIAMSALNFRDADFTKVWNAEGDTAEWRAVRDQVAGGLGLS